MSYRKEITKKDAFFVFIIGLIMGTVFCFGNQFWYRPITPEEAIHTTATYSKFDLQYNLPRLNHTHSHNYKLRVYFEDYESLLIYSWRLYGEKEMINKFHQLSPGTEVELIIHPDSDTILDMRTDNAVLIEFDESIDILSYENNGFSVLSIIMYSFSALGLFYFIHLNYKRYKKIKQKKNKRKNNK
ncbi:MAG: hypothetical protein E7479_07080 [Ruminococcaceae bacterium]|nr:hypothetical protein [Oscillospiraceae bacterium]